MENDPKPAIREAANIKGFVVCRLTLMIAATRLARSLDSSSLIPSRNTPKTDFVREPGRLSERARRRRRYAPAVRLIILADRRIDYDRTVEKRPSLNSRPSPRDVHYSRYEETGKTRNTRPARFSINRNTSSGLFPSATGQRTDGRAADKISNSERLRERGDGGDTISAPFRPLTYWLASLRYLLWAGVAYRRARRTAAAGLRGGQLEAAVVRSCNAIVSACKSTRSDAFTLKSIPVYATSAMGTRF
ncbi:hypothetical protein EVAR_45643_1 [Eumeta japonica]|uniref:Uncharacterized protein n=1 Tax=Eumeta variegata TaxID=151549 RepID=A0A4C1Y394_EUMVA|nr:hypothetical protein EVAR_45643_1 [Eumeta japonica]